jgi:hypothetical protein
MMRDERRDEELDTTTLLLGAAYALSFLGVIVGLAV